MKLTVARLRPIRPDDKAALLSLHRGLSEESRYRRYHAAKGDLTSSDLRYLTEIDGHDHVALVAELSPPELDGLTSALKGFVGGPPELAGVVRIVADPARPGEAELAIVVRDDAHGAGLGKELVQAILDHALALGHARVVADVQSDNYRALRLFQGLGFRQRAHHGITVELVRELTAR